MNRKDVAGGRSPNERRGPGTRLVSAVLGRTAKRSRPADALLELSSIDMWVDFCEDRLEYRRRLGSKHGIVPYAHVRTVTLQQRSPTTISVGDTTFGASREFSKKLVLQLDSRRSPLIFDFRSEPIDLVQQALDVINRRLAHGTSDRSDVPSFTDEPPENRVDQLAKLVALKDAGNLTTEEFEREKARILDE